MVRRMLSLIITLSMLLPLPPAALPIAGERSTAPVNPRPEADVLFPTTVLTQDLTRRARRDLFNITIPREETDQETTSVAVHQVGILARLNLDRQKSDVLNVFINADSTEKSWSANRLQPLLTPAKPVRDPSAREDWPEVPDQYFARNSNGSTAKQIIGISSEMPSFHAPSSINGIDSLGQTQIVISTSGFTPQIVTVTLGTTVAWTNSTSQTVTIHSGQPFKVFLPLVIKLASSFSTVTSSVAFALNDDFTGVIPSNGTFTHTFTTLGIHPYYLANSPNVTGQVIVQPIPFDFTLAASPGSQSVVQGQSVTHTLYVTGTLGDPQSVALSVSGLPIDSMWSLMPSSVVPTSTAMLAVTTTLTTPVNDYAVIITGTAAGQVHTTTATLSVNPHPDFTLMAQPPQQSVSQGNSATYTVTASALHGFDQPVMLDVTGLPTGASANWSANPITPTSVGALMIDVPSVAQTGTYTLTISGVGGGFTHTTEAALTVTLHDGFILNIAPDTISIPQGSTAAYTATVVGLFDFTNPVTLSVSGLPGSVAATILPNPVIPTGTATISLTSALNAPIGAHGLSLIGMSGGRIRSVPFTLTLTPHPDFAVGVQSSTLNVRQSRAVTTTVNVSALYGFASPVALTIGGLPNGTSAEWGVNTIVPDTATVLTLTTSLTTPLGNQSLIITGTGGGFIHAVPLTLTVLTHPDFAYMVTPPTQAITQGQSITYAAQLIGLNEWNAPVTLSLTGAPTGTIVTWQPDTLTPDGGSVLSMSVGVTTPAGIYPMMAIADGRLVSHTAAITLVVMLHEGFSLNIVPTAASALQGTQAIYTATVTGSYDFTDPITLSVSEMPPGVSAAISPNPTTPTSTAIITLTTALTSPVGSYSLMLTGTGSGRIHSAPFTLTITPQPDFAINAQPTFASVRQSRAVTTQVSVISLSGFADAVTLDVSGLPNGAAAQWANNVVLPDHSTVLTLTTLLTTPLGAYPLMISGSSGGFTHMTPFTLTVIDHPDFSFTVTPSTEAITQAQITTYTAQLIGQNDWSAPVALSLSGAPTGTIATWLPNSITPTATSVLSLSVAATTPVGTYPIMAIADGGLISHTAAMTLVVTLHEGFTLGIMPSTALAPQGAQVGYTATVTGLYGFTDPVTLSVSGMPAGVIATITPNPVTPTSTTTLSLTTALTTPLGDHVLTLTGTGSGRVHSIPFTLTITPRSDFSLSIVPPAQVITQGQAVTYTAYLTRESGFTQPVSLAISGLPTGTLASWAANPVTPTAQTTLTLTTAVTSPVGSYPLTVTGDGGGFTHTETLSLNITSNVMYMCGNISQNTVWEAGYVYVVTCDIAVNAGVVLTIQAGAVVKFSGIRNLTVNGFLLGQGEDNNPIVFTSFKDDTYGGDSNNDGNASLPTPGDWGGITIGSGGIATFDHVIVRYGGNGGYSINGNLANVTNGHGTLNVLNSIMAFSLHNAVQTDSASTLISNTQFISNAERGVYHYNGGISPNILTLVNNTFTDNSTAAELSAIGTSFGTGTQISGNTGSGNANNVIKISIGTSGSFTLGANPNLPYQLAALTIPAGSAIVVQPGAVFKSNGIGSVVLNVTGSCTAQGTSDSPIVFTSFKDDTYGGDSNNDGNASSPGAGDWGGMTVGGTATFDHAIIRYGGNGGYNINGGLASLTNGQGTLNVLNSTVAFGLHNAVQTDGASTLISNTQFINNAERGVYHYNGGASANILTLLNNTFTGNGMAAELLSVGPGPTFGTGTQISGNTGSGNANNVIKVSIKTSGNFTLGTNTNLPYQLVALTIPAGSTITAQPGVVFKSNSIGTAVLSISGNFTAQGTSDSPIVFTSFKDDTYGGDSNNDGNASLPAPGDWRTLTVNSGGAATFDHAIIRYGGYGTTTNDGNLYNNSGVLNLTNSIVALSQHDGVKTTSASTLISNTQFISNVERGMYHSNTGSGSNILTLVNNTFTGNGTAAEVYSVGSSSPFGTGTQISGNTGSGNGTGAIRFSNTYLAGNITLGANPNLPYQLVALTIPAGSTITAQPGVVFKSNSIGTAVLSISGNFTAQGTSDSPIVFTSFKDDTYGGDSNNDGNASLPAPGDWRTLTVNSGGAATFDHAIIRYGGYGTTTNDGNLYNNSGVLNLTNSIVALSQHDGVKTTSASTLISNTQFISNTDRGVYHYNNIVGANIVTLVNNTFTGNGIAAELVSAGSSSPLGTGTQISGNTGSNNVNGVIRFSGTYLAGTVTLGANPNLPYQLVALTIPAGSTITVQPGSVFKSNSTGTAVLSISGNFTAQGTSDSPIVFTSFKDDTYGGDSNNDGSASLPAPGDWGSITIYGSGGFDHTIVRYGGYGTTPSFGSLTNNGGTLNLTTSTIAFSQHDGVRISSGTAWIYNSNIYGNGGYGIYNANTPITVNAENNWWGSDSGPTPYGSGNGINYTTSCSNGVCRIVPYVDVTPWIGQQSYYGQHVPNVAYYADPVNTANGNYAYHHIDLSIPTRGLPLSFARTYNSQSPDNGPLGWGWRHNWQVSAIESSSDTRITYGDGHQIRFTWNGSAYVPDAGIFSTLTKSNGVLHLTEKDQTIYHFDVVGRLASVEDKNGNTTTLAYDVQGRLVNVTEPAGRTLTLTYSSPISSALVSQVADPAGRMLQFTYNITGELAVVTDVIGSPVSMTYDINHGLLTVTDANGHIFVRNVYNSSGRVAEQYDALNNKTTFVYDEPSHKTIVTDPLGQSTIFQYDALLRLTSEKDALNQAASYSYDTNNNRVQSVDRRGYTTTLNYDNRGNPLVITDTLGNITRLTYDVQNNLLSQTDPLGHAKRFAYDSKSNPIVITDALGYTMTMTYYADAARNGLLATVTDARGNVTHYDYDAYGSRTAITDTLSNATRITYDLIGRKVSDVNARSYTTTYEYDTANRIVAVTDTLRNRTSYAYNAVGNRVVITDALGHPTLQAYNAKDQLVIITDTLGYTTIYTYNPNSKQIAVQDKNGHVTTYGYDPIGRLVTATNPLNQSTVYAYDANGNRIAATDALTHGTTFAYDALNQLTATTDPLGNVTRNGYDAVGNKTVITDANGIATHYGYDALNHLTVVTDSLTGTIQYAYDGVGNKTVMTDANSHVTAYSYDALNRLAHVSDPLLHTTAYGYDAIGNRAVLTDANNVVTVYTYDAANRPLTSQSPGLLVSNAYDALGNRTVMTDTNGATTFAYDALSRLVTASAPSGVVAYRYDGVDRTQTIYPDGKTVTNTYDTADRLHTVADWAGRVTTYTYDPAGRQIQLTNPNATTATYQYDNADRLLAITHTSTVSGTFAFFRYGLDNVGNRLVMTDTDGGTRYTYDNLYRLTHVVYPTGTPITVTYAYDAMGNRVAMTDTAATTYTFDAADRLLNAGPTSFTWDDNGNMLSKGSIVYSWDTFNRLTGVMSGTQTVTFTYNGDGVRVGKSVNGTRTAYVQDLASGLPVVLVDTTGGQSNRYTYGNDLVAQIDQAGNPMFFHADGLGSTRHLSNGGGQNVATYDYDAFGAVRTQTGGTGNPFTFTGEQSDVETGLIFLRARYYDLQIGRFITKDPFDNFLESTQDRNRYVYVENNPTGRFDPAGLAWQIFGGMEGSALLGPVGLGGQSKLTLENVVGNLAQGRLPGTSASASASAGFGFDVGLGPKAGIAYETSTGLGLMPEWLQIKGGTLKLPFSEFGLTIGRNKFAFEAALRVGAGIAFKPNVGFEYEYRVENVGDRIGDWIYFSFFQGSTNYSGGGFGGGGGSSWGDPPSKGK